MCILMVSKVTHYYILYLQLMTMSTEILIHLVDILDFISWKYSEENPLFFVPPLSVLLQTWIADWCQIARKYTVFVFASSEMSPARSTWLTRSGHTDIDCRELNSFTHSICEPANPSIWQQGSSLQQWGLCMFTDTNSRPWRLSIGGLCVWMLQVHSHIHCAAHQKCNGEPATKEN